MHISQHYHLLRNLPAHPIQRLSKIRGGDMFLSSLQLQILNPFIEESLFILDKTLGLSSNSNDGFQEKLEDFKFKGYAVVTNTSGSITGRILIHHYSETALEIGHRLLQKKGVEVNNNEEMDDEISNALAEFALSIIEPAISALHNSDIDIKVSQPYFVSDTEKIDHMLEEVQEIITVPIQVDKIGRFYLNYLIHENANPENK